MLGLFKITHVVVFENKLFNPNQIENIDDGDDAIEGGK